jgi:uncharacterized integral membrane protein
MDQAQKEGGMAFVAHLVWQERAGGWLTVLFVAVVVTVVFALVYCLNQYAVRAELVPRRQEFETLLMSLHDETHAASESPKK